SKISAIAEPARASITASRSTNDQRSRSASAFPTLVLPAPMNPTSTIRTGGSATAGGGGEHVEEARERHRDAVGPFELRLAGGGEARDGQRHRDAVVAVGAHARAAQALPARQREAVLALLDRDAHASEALDQRRDAIALLDAQLARAADAERSLGHRAGHGEDGDLVDERGHALGRDGDSAQARRARHDRADRLGGALGRRHFDRA